MNMCYYSKKSFTNKMIMKDNPLLYKEAPYYGKNAFPYYRGKSLTNKEIIQGNPLL